MADWIWEDELDLEVAEEVIRSIDANVVSEVEYLNKAGQRIGYWAYGYFDPNFPYQGDGYVSEAGYDIR